MGAKEHTVINGLIAKVKYLKTGLKLSHTALRPLAFPFVETWSISLKRDTFAHLRVEEMLSSLLSWQRQSSWELSRINSEDQGLKKTS